MILCAVDESEAADAVLDTARWLAEGLHAPLRVIHVGAPSPAAEQLVERARERLGDERADVRVVSGSPAEAIRETADGEDAELLVVGSRGHGGLRSAVLGSVSRELATRARRPVVVVPPGEVAAADDGNADSDGASVVCGVDGSDQALAGAAFAGRLAQRLGYRLVVVHARQNVRAAVVPGSALRDAAGHRPNRLGRPGCRPGRPASRGRGRRERDRSHRARAARRDPRVGCPA